MYNLLNNLQGLGFRKYRSSTSFAYLDSLTTQLIGRDFTVTFISASSSTKIYFLYKFKFYYS